jgi:predicted nucleotidyltransferase
MRDHTKLRAFELADKENDLLEIRTKIAGIIENILSLRDIQLLKIVLFGSRAKGFFDQFSDYDLLIIINKKLTRKEKIKLFETINQTIVNTLHIPVDIIIKSEEEVHYYKDKIGSITREALREGITL